MMSLKNLLQLETSMNIWDEVFKSGIYPSRVHTLRHLKIGRVFKKFTDGNMNLFLISTFYVNIYCNNSIKIFKKERCNKKYNMTRCKNENLSTKDVQVSQI